MKLRELFESISSEVYHYTKLGPAVTIVESGVFMLASSIGNPTEEKLAPKGLPYYLSTTRTKLGAYHKNPYNGEVMFNMNGDWYNRRYKGGPVDYWNNRHDHTYGRVSEAEDRIFSKEPTIPATGITSIHVYLDVSKDLLHYAEGIRKLFILAKSKSIPISLYINPVAWVAQDTRQIVSISSILPVLKNIKKTPRKQYGPSRFNTMKDILELVYKNSTNQLSKNADKLAYALRYYADTINGLQTDMANARKPGSDDRKYLDNLIKAMRTNGWQNTEQLGGALKEKWTQIQKNESEAKIHPISPT